MELFSAKEASYEFLLRKVGKDLAVQMIDSATGGTDGSKRERWMLKYMAFGAIILKHRKLLNMGCARVISIGDGQDEALAVREYAKEHKVQCIHFEFLRYPVIEQLHEQWAIVERTFAKLITVENTDKDDHCVLHQMSSIYKVDNNQQFSGSMRQLPALSAYFKLWLSLVVFLILDFSQFIHCRFLYQDKLSEDEVSTKIEV